MSARGAGRPYGQAAAAPLFPDPHVTVFAARRPHSEPIGFKSSMDEPSTKRLGAGPSSKYERRSLIP